MRTATTTKHSGQSCFLHQLERYAEPFSRRQIGSADVILLNKVDLVSVDRLATVESKIRWALSVSFRSKL